MLEDPEANTINALSYPGTTPTSNRAGSPTQNTKFVPVGNPNATDNTTLPASTIANSNNATRASEQVALTKTTATSTAAGAGVNHTTNVSDIAIAANTTRTTGNSLNNTLIATTSTTTTHTDAPFDI